MHAMRAPFLACPLASSPVAYSGKPDGGGGRALGGLTDGHVPGSSGGVGEALEVAGAPDPTLRPRIHARMHTHLELDGQKAQFNMLAERFDQCLPRLLQNI